MNNIFALSYEGKSFNQRKVDSCVNVGQMCANFGKRLRDWTRLESSKAYLDALSANAQICALELIEVKEGNTGTWAHPLVAIEIGRWISPDFGVWCNMHIKTLLETGKVKINKQPQTRTEKIKEDLDAAGLALDFVFSDVELNKYLMAGIRLNTAQSMLPEIAPHIEGSRQVLITSTANKEQLLTVTEIGKLCNPQLSAKEVNVRLIEFGYQTKNPNKKGKKDAAYTPTHKGKEYCDFVLSTGKNKDNTTYSQLRWYESIYQLIQD